MSELEVVPDTWTGFLGIFDYPYDSTRIGVELVWNFKEASPPSSWDFSLNQCLLDIGEE